MNPTTAARIAQAQGLIAVYDDCTPIEALERMHACVHANGHSLAHVASIVIERHRHVVAGRRPRLQHEPN